MEQALRFIRKNGRVIPIRGALAGGAAGRDAIKASAALATRHAFRKEPKIAGNKKMSLASEGLVLAGGILSGATLGGGMKGFLAGHLASTSLDIGATALGVGAFAGKDHLKARAKAVSEQELKNQAIGWGAFAATALAVPSSRKRLAETAAKVVAFGRKALLRGV